MEFFEGRYYRINKYLLRLVGQWPFGEPTLNRTVLILVTLVAGTQFMSKICALVKNRYDFNLVFESLPPMMVDLMVTEKMVNFVIMKEQVTELLRRIKTNYECITSSQEIEILNEFGEKGRRFTLIYAGSLFSMMFVYIMMPCLTVMIHRQENSSNRPPLLHSVEYFIDIEKYHYPIFFHGMVTVIIATTSGVAMDSIFNVLVQHACSLFAVVRYRLEHAIGHETLEYDLHPPMKDDKSYEEIVRSIEFHKMAINFADLTAATFSMSMLFQGGINILAMSVTGIQAMMNLDNPDELARQFAIQFALLFRLFLENYQGQLLCEHSSRVQTSLINTKWYQMSMRSRTLLCFMIMKAYVPSELTAGKLYPVSMATYSTIVRTSMSYFTLFRSVQ